MTRHMSRTEAFKSYGARLKNPFWSMSAENAHGELVVSLWGHHILPSGSDTIRFADKVSRWPGPGNKEFRERIEKVFTTGQVVRVVIARTDDENAVQAGRDASQLKNTFHVRPEWFGRVTVWDGDNYEIEFVDRKSEPHQ